MTFGDFSLCCVLLIPLGKGGEGWENMVRRKKEWSRELENQLKNKAFSSNWNEMQMHSWPGTMTVPVKNGSWLWILMSFKYDTGILSQQTGSLTWLKYIFTFPGASGADQSYCVGIACSIHCMDCQITKEQFETHGLHFY